LYPAIASRISVEGVPGYAHATDKPDSQAPRASASLPERNDFLRIIPSYTGYREYRIRTFGSRMEGEIVKKNDCKNKAFLRAETMEMPT
jgi:hypothetical protein